MDVFIVFTVKYMYFSVKYNTVTRSVEAGVTSWAAVRAARECSRVLSGFLPFSRTFPARRYKQAGAHGQGDTEREIQKRNSCSE